ncbi:hypothetical protein [Streptomyces prunicolor]|uniref:hypothetical protein n=1 Tax=Streptomyces prunicolor TaxID=67348 RepID=UPI0033FDFE31
MTKPHKPGEAPETPPRDHNGVQTFASKQPEPCPKGMQLDPATGECIATEGTES